MKTSWRRLTYLRLILACSWLAACRGDERTALFHLLSPSRTGVSFANTLTPTAAHNFENDFFFYNGAGVAIGDINNDGLPDIYFTGNMVSSRLYLNKGDFRFDDVTRSAGVATSGWATGATMADVNGDGHLDIYVCVSGAPSSTPHDRANLLFINNGNGSFTESAARYGLADPGFSTHAVFLDYDADGYPDLYVLNNSPAEFGRGQTAITPFGSFKADSTGFDHLYHNNRDGTFSNVSRRAGILQQVGYGLGVAVADFNRDGWPDLYISNDISSQDVLYVNNRDGTFRDRTTEWLGHTSYAGMGVDVADFDNNGWPDILQMDMLPPDPVARKRVSGATTYQALLSMTQRGGMLQYNANTLQLNQGVGQGGQVIFSEIARLAGVSATGWSWSPLFADFDNDGFKDVFVTTGYPKALIDYDYETESFKTEQLADTARARRRRTTLLDSLYAYRLPNYAFHNNGDLTFRDVSRQWGLDQAAFSYGAAYADLNNDGRLDLVVNNLNGRAHIYQNVRPRNDSTHYLEIRLDGDARNRQGLGATLILTAGGRTQYMEQSPYHGFMSTMDDRVHFGLGRAGRIDSLRVVWSDGSQQLLKNVTADQIITLHQRAAARAGVVDSLPVPAQAFRPMAANTGVNYTDRQHDFLVDYLVQPLLPYQISRQGPPIAAADVDGNGLDDVFVGAADGFPAHLFVQQGDGRFVAAKSQPWAADSAADDWGALFFDANGDGRPDLYVASGGYRRSALASDYQDRLYINQGHGTYVKAVAALPDIRTSTKAVAACDFNGDGRLDLFVGGRLTPREYPNPTRSYVLRNDGVRFTDVTSAFAPELVKPGGMVTSAVCIDFNGDGRTDLVTAGEWMAIQFYANEGAHLTNVTSSMHLPPTRGWWYSLASGDLDHDGRVDLVAGNLGLNYSYTTSKENKFGVYATRIGSDRTVDIILTQQVDGKKYPYYGLALLGGAINELAIRYTTFASFANATIEQVLGAQLATATHYEADTFASVWLRNNGDGTFTMHELPNLAQISPIQSILIDDVDGDGNLDLLVAGNIDQTEANTARADAGKGLWLKGDGHGGFIPVPPSTSGFLAPYDARGLTLIHTPKGRALVVSNNEGPLQWFALPALTSRDSASVAASRSPR